jgi:hypothetical protein
MRDYSSTHNCCAVSFLAEAEINEAQALDALMVSKITDVPNIETHRGTNEDEKNGTEEPTEVFETTTRLEMPMTFERAQAQHFAFLLAFGLGAVQTDVIHPSGVYLHNIRPINGEYDKVRSNPSFSLMARVGETVTQDVFASVFVDSVTAKFEKDKHVSLSSKLIGTGCRNQGYEKREYSYTGDTTELYAGSIRGNNVDNIHSVDVLIDGAWMPVEVESVASGNIVIRKRDDLVAEETYTFRVVYLPENSFIMPTAPIFETPLFVSDITVHVGGKWNGDQFVGGRSLDADLESISYDLENNLSFETGFGSTFEQPTGETYTHANRVYRERRSQRITIEKKFKDMIMQAQHIANDNISLHIKAMGKEFYGNEAYIVEMIFPKLGFSSGTIGVDDRKNIESFEMVVLEDSGDSVIVRVKNAVEKYIHT